jgi:hypothetical protein
MKKINLIASLAALALATAAHADTVNMSFQGTGKGSNVHVNYFGGGIDVFAGQLKHQITSGTGVGTQLVGDWRTFCADFDQHVSGSSSVFDVVSPIELTVRGTDLGAGRAAALAGLYSAFGTSAGDANASNDLGAAFQIAVWEIIYDFNPSLGLGSIDLTSGNIAFSQYGGGAISGNLLNQFNALVASFTSGSAAPSLLALENGERQDQLLYGSTVSIPTPGATSLAICGILLCSRRRRPAA